MNNDYSHFGDMPEIPDIIPEDDPVSAHLIGCMYGIASLVMFAIVLIILILIFG